MSTIISKRSDTVPEIVARPGVLTVSADPKIDLLVKSGINKFFDHTSLEERQWKDRIGGESAPAFYNATSTDVATGVIGGKTYLNFTNAQCLLLPNEQPFFNPAEFTIGFIRRPQAAATDHDPIASRPITKEVTSAIKTLRIATFYDGGGGGAREFYSVVVDGASATSISLGAATYHPRTAPHFFLVAYSVARGYTVRSYGASGAPLLNVNVPSPSADQTVTSGLLQFGQFAGSTGDTNFMNGGLSDLMQSDSDLTTTANATKLAAIVTQMTTDWLT